MLRKICEEVEQLVIGNEQVRYFVFDDVRLVIDDETTSTPLLISRIKKRRLGVDDFKIIKNVCKQVFGEMFSLLNESVCGYETIRSFRLYG